MYSPWQMLGPWVGGRQSVPPVVSDVGELRRFSKMQFSQLTGIVGTRIDRALADMISRFNGLQPDDLNRRGVARQFVGGFSPLFGPDKQDPTPFMNVYNGATAVNPHRLKGTFNDCSTPLLQYAWTNAMYFPRPVRIVGLNVNAMSLPGLATYANPLAYGVPAPDPRQPNDWLNDMYVDLSVDSKWYKSNARKLNESEIQKAHFTAENQLFSPQALSVSMTDPMVPEYPEDPVWLANYGICIDVRNVNMAIPEQSTVRLAILFPDYDGTVTQFGTSSVTGWNTDTGAALNMPWANQVWSYTVTVVESLS